MEITQRMLTLENGSRTSIKLDAPSWQAVDFAATKAGAKWDEWAVAALTKAGSVNNMTAAIRATAIQVLLDEIASGLPDSVTIHLQKGRIVKVESK